MGYYAAADLIFHQGIGENPTIVKYILGLYEKAKGKLAHYLFSGSLRGLKKY